jgi:uroporphyrinogen-III synthase
MEGSLIRNASFVWTRSRPDWSEDQLLLKDLPFSVIHLPCLSFKPLARERQFAELDVVLGKGVPLVLVFTSAWGVRFAWDNSYLRSQLPSATIYALGEGTARAISKLGFRGAGN